MQQIENIIKKTFRILFIIFLLLVFNEESKAFSSPLFTKDCSKNNKQYFVKAVFDGDTILLRTGEGAKNDTKIRFLGIDAFEHDQLPYGKLGKDFLTKLLLNKNVCIETDVQENDIYKRTLGYVFLQGVIARSTESAMKQSHNDLRNKIALSGLKPSLAMTDVQYIFVNEELLKNGFALLYDFPPNVKYISRLKKAQIYARQNMLGVWENHSYIIETPAQWRKKHPFKQKLTR